MSGNPLTDTANYTMEGVINYLTKIVSDYNTEHAKWDQEKRELMIRIKELEQEKASLEQQLVEQDRPINRTYSSSSSFLQSLKRSESGRRYCSLPKTLRLINQYINKPDSRFLSLSSAIDESFGHRPLHHSVASDELGYTYSSLSSHEISHMTFPHTIPDDLSQNIAFTSVPAQPLEPGKKERMNEVEVVDMGVKNSSQDSPAKRVDVADVAVQDSVSPAPIEGNNCSRSESISPCPPMSSEDPANEDMNSLVSQVPEPLSNPNTNQESQDQGFMNENDIPDITQDKPTNVIDSSSSNTFPLDSELEPVSHFHNYTLNQTTYFHLGPIQALTYNQRTNVLASCDRNGTICLWDTIGENFVPNSTPSQVIYSSGMILSASWMPSFGILSVGDADGAITLYQVSTSQPSVSYDMNGFQSCYDETDGLCNGLFDSSRKEPLPIFVNHSDSVWCLYNNYDAPFNQQSLLFSSGADGPLLCYDVERDTCDGYSVDSPVSSITSNGCYSDVLFTGDMGGKVNVIDIERKETTHSFDPFVICPSYYSQYNITSDPIYSIAVHSTQPLIAAGTKYGQVHLFDARDNHVIASYSAHTDSISQIAFHPWDHVVMTASYDDSFKLWSAQDRSLISQYNNLFKSQFDESSIHFAVSPISDSIVVGGVSGAIQYYS